MGGSSKKTTVGYWYSLLAHYGLSKGPIDAFLELRGGDRKAWKGLLTQSDRINVNKPNLWGGESSEGGLDGDMDIMFGEGDQQANDYLASQLGADQPTYRGKCTAVWRGGRYGAMNPYPKPLSFKIRRILKGWDNDECWYPETAAIPLTPYPVLAFYFALDFSGSMDTETPNGSTRFENLQAAMSQALDALGDLVTNHGCTIDVIIVGWGTAESTRISIQRRNCNASDINALKSWLNSQSTGLQTYFPSGVMDAGAFYSGAPTNSRNLMFFVTDGLASATGKTAQEITSEAVDIINGLTASVRIYGINIDLEDTTYTAQLDNTNGDRVPVIAGDNLDLLVRIIYAAAGQLIGMNPAHILYDSITARDMQGEPIALINDESFKTAADKLFDEGFGLCTTFEDEDIEEFQQRICNVIGAALTQSRVDGKYYLDLIRGDYILEELPIITSDDIIDFSQEPSNLTETVNEIRVEWFDPETKEDRTTPPIQALGSIQAAGGVISETRSYPEIAIEPLAIKAGMRDLAAGNTPLSRLNLTVNRRFASLRPATYFRLQYPEAGIADMVCIIGDIEDSAGSKGNIKLISIQDVFSFPDTVFVESESGLATVEDISPTSPSAMKVIEAPYVELAEILSNADLAALPDDAGFFMVMAARPSNGLNYNLYTSFDGTSYEVVGRFDWTPSCLAAEDVSYLDVVISITSGTDLSLVEVGTWGIWDEEIFRVDDINIVEGTVTVGRGCADTVPAKHDAESRLWFCGDWASTDGNEYAAAEEAWYKTPSRTSSDEQLLSGITAMSIIQNERQIRPYPPGNFRVNDISYPETVGDSTITMEWAHRDRVMLADQLIDATAIDVGPESGTTYRIEVDAYDSSMTLIEADWLILDVGSVKTYTIDFTAMDPPEGATILDVHVRSVREGVDSLQFVSVIVYLLVPPSFIAWIYKPLTSPSDLTAINV